MAGNIWMVADQWRGQLSEVTYELLALGRELADALGTSLEVVLLGHGIKGLAASLGAADTVLAVDHPGLAEPTSETYSQVLAALIRERQPRCLLLPLTNSMWDVTAVLPADLEVPFVNFCHNVRVQDEEIRAHCLLYGGKMEAVVAAREAPTILGVSPGTRPAEQGHVEGSPAVEDIPTALPDELVVRFKEYLEPEAGEIDITQQDVLVSVGRGLQTEDNLDLAKELAEILGGAVCGSRPAIDQGWLPLSRQVGKSGMQVKPKLYLALGISGAPEHVEGIKGAALTVAINTDPDAPIFNVAQYGITEDLFDVVPELIEKAKALKGG